ncbi:cohesin domain-containing protein, partial [Ruminococcus sp. XPD3002]|uniref:cohesin domain-containing protein n=1 Tax=Ruminococcus sp. XPD3002 TaxID=1452269 RepID=UPI00091ED079
VGDVATGTATWDIADKVPAKAGEKVDVQIKVVGDSDLGVSGAQFKIKPDTATFDSAKGPSVYSVTVEGNKATSEVAFGNGSGEVYTAKDGDAVVTITLDVPAGTPAGEYPVDWVKDAFLQITGANGADVTDKVTLTGGSIIIEDPNVTTTAPSTDTTPVDTTAVTPGTDTTPVDTTAVTPGTDTTPVDTTAVTPGTETTPVDTTVVTPGTDTTPVQTDEQGNPVTTPAGTDTTPVQTDEQGNPVTTPVGTDTTPVNPTTAQGGDVTATTSVAGTGQSGQTVTVPAGAIVWQLNNTKAKPGETVTLTMSVKDPNGTKLPVGGAQFVLTPNGASLVGADGKPYTNDLEVNTNTNEFAFGAFDGTADVLNDGDQILTVSYKVPDNAKLGDIIPINFSGLTVVDEKGNDITKSVVTIDGYIEIVDNTTTAPVQTDENGNPVTSPAGTDTTPVQTDE